MHRSAVVSGWQLGGAADRKTGCRQHVVCGGAVAQLLDGHVNDLVRIGVLDQADQICGGLLEFNYADHRKLS